MTDVATIRWSIVKGEGMDKFKIALDAQKSVNTAFTNGVPVIVRWQGVEIKVKNAWCQRKRHNGFIKYEVIMEGDAE